MFGMAGGADPFVPGPVPFAPLVAVSPDLAVRLAAERLAEARVHVRRGRATERVVGVRVGALLAVATQDVVVVRLRWHRVYGVRAVGTLLGRCARRQFLCMEYGDLVIWFGLHA